jgi:hypothetical protein
MHGLVEQARRLRLLLLLCACAGSQRCCVPACGCKHSINSRGTAHPGLLSCCCCEP